MTPRQIRETIRAIRDAALSWLPCRAKSCWHILHGNQGFFTTAFAISFLFLLVALAPVAIEQAREKLTDELVGIWTLPREALYCLDMALGVVTGLSYLACWRIRRFAGLRALVLVAVVTFHLMILAACRHMEKERERQAGLAEDIHQQQWINLRRLKIVDYYSRTMENSHCRKVDRAHIQSFTQLHDWVKKEYLAAHENLGKELKGFDEEQRKVIFFLHFVADLWAFGNKSNRDLPGSVFANETNDWHAAAATSVRTYLDSKIGCCSDMACLLKYLLDQENIENRLTSIPGHVFNEVRLHGKWHIVDPTIDVIIDTSWDENYLAGDELPPDSIRVMVFPHPNLRREDSWKYRSVVGQFRLMMLLDLAYRPESCRLTCHPSLPDYFK